MKKNENEPEFTRCFSVFTTPASSAVHWLLVREQTQHDLTANGNVPVVWWYFTLPVPAACVQLEMCMANFVHLILQSFQCFLRDFGLLD